MRNDKPLAITSAIVATCRAQRNHVSHRRQWHNGVTTIVYYLGIMVSTIMLRWRQLANGMASALIVVA